MDKGAGIIVILLVACAAGGGALLFTVGGPGDYSHEGSITYVLDGGINADENVSSYEYNIGAELYDPFKSGFIFGGWYKDLDFTDPVYSITKAERGDITLYASWEKSLVGTQYVFDITGSMTDISFFSGTVTATIDGTMTYGYLTYSEEREYYVDYVRDLTITTSSSVIPDNVSDRYWSSDVDDDVTWKYSGLETISTINGDVLCYVVIGSDGTYSEKQYIGDDDGVVYKIEYLKETTQILATSKTEMTYVLTAINQLNVAEDLTVKGYADIGITVSGSGSYDAYDVVTLTATVDDGTEFLGWYDEKNNLLSKSKTYHVDRILVDVEIYAKNGDEPDYICKDNSIDVQPEIPLTDVTWTVEDGEDKIIISDDLNYKFTKAGEHLIKYEGTDADGKKYYGMFTAITEQVLRTFNWNHNGHPYTYDLWITYDDYLEYRNDTISRRQGTTSHDLKFVTYTDSYIVKIANDFKHDHSTFTELEMANFILEFTQYIPYVTDEESRGTDEFWKYPLETLYDQNGDCEDTAILCCAIMKAMGYKTALFILPGHAATGVSADGATGTYFEKNGVKYFYCETTATGYKVGMIPPDYNSATVIPVV